MGKRISFSIQELRHVTISCRHCSAKLVLDMAQFEPPVPPRSGDRLLFAPRACAACKTPYDTAVNALDELQRVYRTLAKLDGVIGFEFDEAP